MKVTYTKDGVGGGRGGGTPDALRAPCEYCGNFKTPNGVPSSPRTLPCQLIRAQEMYNILILIQTEYKLRMEATGIKDHFNSIGIY